jgi:hypothetical protein
MRKLEPLEVAGYNAPTCDVCGEVVTSFRDHNREAYPLHLELTGQQHLLLQAGERVELVATTDRYTSLEPGARGTVLAVRGRDTYPEPAILVAWDDGSSLAMLPETGDEIRKVGAAAPLMAPNDRRAVDGPYALRSLLRRRTAHEATFPDVTVQLTGEDGNVFAVIGAVQRALRRSGYREEASAFAREAMAQSSYDEVLQLVMRTVEVE